MSKYTNGIAKLFIAPRSPTPNTYTPPHQIVTFDAGGVSGHPNHGALAHAMAQLPGATGRITPKVWLLETTPLVRKYLGPLEVLLSLVLSALARCVVVVMGGGGGGRRGETRVSLNSRPWVAYSAMLAHASQFVWYRRLFILFSRYTYVNTLVALGPSEHRTAGGAQTGRRKSKAGFKMLEL